MTYEKRGVSAAKEDVHNAIKGMDKGLYPNAFCKILPDIAGGSPDFVNIMHADTAGTKTALAYLYWRETGDVSVWKGIAQDALVMNFDDMACAGATDNYIISSTIGRNKNLVSGEVIKAIIEGTNEFIARMATHGITINHAGGETADVGDIVRTADVGFTVFARYPKKDVLNIDVKPGDVIVGFASYGQATYEQDYNSGIGSNGLTFARHELLDNSYAAKYPESFDPNIDKEYIYTGNCKLTGEFEGYTIGKLMLSPTRTFIPLIKAIIDTHKSDIHGIIHNTGGGQTKALHFIDNLHLIKDKLLPIPPVFRLIQSQKNTDWKEMYKVFNMGQRLEVYTDEKTASSLISIASSFNIHAQVVGMAEKGDGKKIILKTKGGEWEY